MAIDTRRSEGLVWPLSEIRAGLLAPIEAVGFLWRRKGFLALCLLVQTVACLAYFWSIARWAVPVVDRNLNEALANQSHQWIRFIVEHGAMFSLYLLAFLLYAVVVLPVVNVLAGPLFDWIAATAYGEYSAESAPNLRFRDFVRSIFFELAKTLFLFAFLFVSVVSYFAVFLAPVVLVVALWYLGWEQMDRTLGTLGYRPWRRIAFGIVHCVACVSLGVWMVIPLFGTFFAFAFAPAGAIAVARVIRVARPG